MKILLLARGWCMIGYCLAGFAGLLGGQKPTSTLTPEQKVEYYRQGAALQYKQLLAANQRIAELEARVESDRLEREATQLLREMAEWRRKVLGDAACTIEEPGAKVVCPPLSPARGAPNLSGDATRPPEEKEDSPVVSRQ